MSDEDKAVEETTTEETSSERTIDNVQAEMARKMKNIEARNEELVTQNQQTNTKLDAIMQQISTPSKPAPSQSNEDLEYMKQYEPDKYIDMKFKEMEQDRANERAQNAQTATIDELNAKYPDLEDSKSDLYKKTLEKASKYNQNFRTSAEGIRLAVMEAVNDLGASKVVKKESEEDQSLDEFIGSSGKGSGASSRPKSDGSGEKLDPMTEEFARQVGLNIDDSKVKERIKERGKRDYRRWK